MMISFAAGICNNLEAASRREWLETNGIGGFASSTITGLNTRRYHGLLTAALTPPVGRCVLLSRLEETLVVNGERFDLSSNQYPGVIHPQGFRYLKQFRLDPFPVFTYEVAGLRIEKSVFMPQGENSTVVEYHLAPDGHSGGNATAVVLEIRPLLAFRDYHSTTHQNGSLNAQVDERPALARVAPYPGMPPLYVAHNAHKLQITGDWYRNFEYQAERERGLDFREDLFNPYLLTFDLAAAPASMIASTEPRDVSQAAHYRQQEIDRRRKVAAAAPVNDDFVRQLTMAADQYIVSRGTQKSIIAGYHWFADWGRDTMIALPGLTLPAGRFDVARSILKTFAQHVDRGMLPNRFPDAGEAPEYNTVDATLWFIEAVRAFLAYSQDFDFVQRDLYPVLADIIQWHLRGTRYGIKADASSGLLNAGEAGVQLTWMDAKVGDWVVTPRRGKPVEIQALWYNALCVMEELAQRFGDDAGRKRYHSLAALTRWSFNRVFWNEKDGCLYDVVNGGPPDASIRPNQVFAVSLPHSMLNQERSRQVLRILETNLLTPYGLRSLAPGDPQYRARYAGDPASRDGAYHQGTVWPWLLGPFIASYLKVNGRTEQTLAQASAWLSPLQDHLADAGLGHIGEIFDGDQPHRPAGCIAQAWSVAEVLRALVEDVHGIRPQAVKGAVSLSS